LASRHPSRARRLLMRAVAPDMAGSTRVYPRSSGLRRFGSSACRAWPRRAACGPIGWPILPTPRYPASINQRPPAVLRESFSLPSSGSGGQAEFRRDCNRRSPWAACPAGRNVLTNRAVAPRSLRFRSRQDFHSGARRAGGNRETFRRKLLRATSRPRRCNELACAGRGVASFAWPPCPMVPDPAPSGATGV
jgi:hypothetical protein